MAPFKKAGRIPLPAILTKGILLFLFALGALEIASPIKATDYVSSSFIVRDPILNGGGAIATSSSFQYIPSTIQTALGESVSTSFTNRSGALYFSTTTLTQNTYRWYDNADALTPTNPKANENTSISGVASGDVLRLRISITASGEPFAKQQSFKLQYAALGSAGSCAAVSSSNYADIGGVGSATIWRGHDNSSVNDGTQITSRLLSTSGATGSSETYQEANPSAESPDFIYVGANSDAEWDWAIEDHGASGSSTYCFRQILGGGSALNTYTNYPSVTTAASAVVPPTPVAGGGGGGGGGGLPLFGTNAIFSGRAYPSSTVVLLKDAQIVATTIAGPDSLFQIYISNLSGGNYIFSVYSEDSSGVRSSLLTFPVSLAPGATTTVSGIFIAPTISADKIEVRQGDNIAIFGQSTPDATITIQVNSAVELFKTANSDKKGIYLYNLDTAPLEKDQHSAKSKAATNGEISSFSQAVSFTVGDKNIAAQKPIKCPQKADLNGDCKVNLVDFSIAAYWYQRTLSDAFKVLELSQLNGDGKVNIVDFSIMAYYWTG